VPSTASLQELVAPYLPYGGQAAYKSRRTSPPLSGPDNLRHVVSERLKVRIDIVQVRAAARTSTAHSNRNETDQAEQHLPATRLGAFAYPSLLDTIRPAAVRPEALWQQRHKDTGGRHVCQSELPLNSVESAGCWKPAARGTPLHTGELSRI
jgi:hypothetical protein